MRLANDGLALWYGTSDAPAPENVEQPARGVTVVVGVQPAVPSNLVAIRYRVDGGPVLSVPAVCARTDYAHNVQYFRATFPDFWNGERVEYVPTLTSVGRSVPAASELNVFPSAFRIQPWTAQPRSRVGRRGRSPGDPTARFSFELEFIARVTVHLQSQPEVIGSTPAGFVANWYPAAGLLSAVRG